MKTLAIILPSIIGKGGTERAVTNLANLCTEQGIKVYVLSTDTVSGTSPYDLNKDVQVINCGLNVASGNMIKKIVNLFKLKFLLLCYIKMYSIDAVIGTYSLLNCLLTTIAKKVFVVGCEHMNYESANKLNSFLRKKRYHLLNKVVVLTEGDARNYTFVPKEKLAVIPNSLSFPAQQIASYNSSVVLALGRLAFQKGYDMMIQVAQKVHDRFPDWQFVIAGQGPDEPFLRKQISDAHLENYVKIIPPQSDVKALYGSASIYAMTSRFEGLPMVLIEAASCGLPLVSFDCPYGPSSVIKHNENGYLVERDNVSQFSEYLSKLMENEQLRKEMGEKSFLRAKDFSKEIVSQKWCTLFNELEAERK